MWATLPSILWADDQAWVLTTEVDFDSTLVAGTTAPTRELGQTLGLEFLPIWRIIGISVPGRSRSL
jgi:hypothetical protein